MSDTHLVPVQKFDFHGDQLDVAMINDRPWVSIRAVCRALGIANQPQQAKLASKPWASVTIIVTQLPGDSQRRSLAFIDLEALPMWLATIETSKVNPLLRPRLIDFQREAARALRDHFFGKAKTTTTTPDRTVGELRDSPREVERMQRLIRAAARAQQVHFAAVEGEIRREQKVPGYKLLVVSVLDRVERRLWQLVYGEAQFVRRLPRPTRDARQLELLPGGRDSHA